MDRQQILLTKILDAASISIDISSFAHRLSRQSVVYLMQGFGLRLGYPFRWHSSLLCPYSSDLADDLSYLSGCNMLDEAKGWGLDHESAKAASRSCQTWRISIEQPEVHQDSLKLLSSVLFVVSTKQASWKQPKTIISLLRANYKAFSADDVVVAISKLRGVVASK